ncbi:MAG TPA: outer membrane beta-barrel protein, partial [Vicinamibacterales bacterium]|nr:outer membrane beta-barrel protein [Vicinamibacterales bacterium]
MRPACLRRRSWTVVLAGAIGLHLNLFGSASAADLPVPVPARAPLVVPWSWTGFYAGAHIGGALTTSDIADPFGAAVYGDRIRSPAFMAGGQIGANYQMGQMVIGAAADLSWANSSGDDTCFAVSGNVFASNCSVHPDLFGTITGRLGYAFGRSLVYVKGGGAWERNNVDMIVNNNPGARVQTSSTSYGAWGWTVGGGIEFALTPAWSLMFEYDLLRFGGRNVSTPYTPGNPLPGSPNGPLAGLSDDVQQVKLGLNYRFGADPTLWPAIASLMPLKAPPLAVTGWEVDAGTRYMYSWGRAQWDLGFGSAANRPGNMLVSKLTWDGLTTNSVELFAHIETPWNVFLNGFIGTGATTSGGQNDEDFHLVAPPPPRPYNNTFSTNVGHSTYGVLDLGYDVLRRGDYKVGPFVGYTYFDQYIFKSGCLQIA